MDSLIALFAVLLAGWFWLDTARARELATGICRATCEHHGFQLLDQTVALRRLGLRQTLQGLRFRRVYDFELSAEGVGRRRGTLVLVGMDLETIDLGLPAPEEEVN